MSHGTGSHHWANMENQARCTTGHQLNCFYLNKLASSKMRKLRSIQALKQIDKLADKSTSGQTDKMTEWQFDMMTGWQDDNRTRWQNDDMIWWQKLVKVGLSANTSHADGSEREFVCYEHPLFCTSKSFQPALEGKPWRLNSHSRTIRSSLNTLS